MRRLLHCLGYIKISKKTKISRRRFNTVSIINQKNAKTILTDQIISDVLVCTNGITFCISMVSKNYIHNQYIMGTISPSLTILWFIASTRKYNFNVCIKL